MWRFRPQGAAQLQCSCRAKRKLATRGRNHIGSVDPDGLKKKLKPAADAVEILHRRFYEGKPARRKNLEEARANEEIARLEDADYEGRSLAMLRRIAGALNQRVEIRFIPIRQSA